jgi:hypothetical protein
VQRDRRGVPVTGPVVPPGGEELRARLLGAICRCLGEDPATADPAEVDDLMRHLIPEVRAYAQAELQGLATMLGHVPLSEREQLRKGERMQVSDYTAGLHAAADIALARAAALAPEEAPPRTDG